VPYLLTAMDTVAADCRDFRNSTNVKPGDWQ
jgi:hypothetical protein